MQSNTAHAVLLKLVGSEALNNLVAELCNLEEVAEKQQKALPPSHTHTQKSASGPQKLRQNGFKLR